MLRFRDAREMGAFAARLFARALRRSRGRFTAAMPGGRTPEHFYRALAGMRLPWERARIFMSDERAVPLSSPDSNFGSARRLLFAPAGVPAASLHPLRPGTGAAAFGRELSRLLGPGGRPDFVGLGLGADGHTASLFPGSPALRARGLAAAALAPSGVKPRRRVTLTLRAINAARLTVLMAAGPAKRAAFEAAVRREKKIPAGLLRPRGELYLLFAEKD